MPAKPLAPSLPRYVQQAVERARKETHKAVAILEALGEKIGQQR
jgi:hypothetical protein